jgi:hypothetical protein
MIWIYFTERNLWQPESLIWSGSFLSFVKSKDYYGIVSTLRNKLFHSDISTIFWLCSLHQSSLNSYSQSHKVTNTKLPRHCSEQILHKCHKHTSVGKTIKFQCHPTRVHCLVYTNFSYPTYLHESMFLKYNSQQNKTQSTDDWGTLCSQIL